jgi:hypothetical protein
MSSLPKLSMRAISDEAYITQLLTMAQLIIEQEPTTLNVDDIIKKGGKRAGREKSKLTNFECLNLSLRLPASDNYSLREIHIRKLELRAGWYIMVDICCDPLGSNALGPLYFSAYENALQQSSYLKGK